MKKTFMAMLLLGGTMSMFAQNTQTGTTTQGNNNTSTSTQGTNTTANPPSGNQQSAGVTGDPSTQTGNNVSNMSNTGATGTTTTTGTTTDAGMNNATGTTGANGTTGSWNGVSASTSWTPETAPSYGWNNYGNWQNMGSVYPTTGNNNNSNMNNMVSTTDNMNSTGSYSAYSGTAVASLPANVQMRFSQDFPAGANNQYSWNQYGDWFQTHYVNGGRLWQYFYSTRGEGYALVLPVLQTYVPENIVASALQKYGSQLYSIAMVKTNSGADAYQIGLLQRGQMSMQYLGENGATVADVWRVEEQENMNSTQSNAAMGNEGSMNNGSGNWSSDMNNQSGSQMNGQSGDKTKTKVKGDKVKIETEHADGSETKIKMEKGKTKVKTTPAPGSNDNNNNQ